ncbi:MAG TPA: carboxypeptidase-like regulatory domain-containing protein, partial [Gemmatimonadaceae bacterium]
MSPLARATHALLALTTLALVVLLAACAHSTARTSVSRDELAAWESRLAAAPECHVRVAPASASPRSDHSAGDATIVVRLVAFGTHDLLDFTHLRVEPLDGASRTSARVDSAGALPEAFTFALPAGRYALVAQSFGYQARTDTVAARTGATDTVTVALEEYQDALRNAHNCRPHGFRHLGERACVTDQISAVLVLDRARDFASHRFRFGLGFPPGDSVDVNLVDDERLCE